MSGNLFPVVNEEKSLIPIFFFIMYSIISYFILFILPLSFIKLGSDPNPPGKMTPDPQQ